MEIKKFDKFIVENLNNNKLNEVLIDRIEDILNAFKPDLEVYKGYLFFHISLEDDNVIENIEVELNRNKTYTTNINGIGVAVYLDTRPVEINFHGDEGEAFTFDLVINKEELLELLKVE